MKRLLMIGALAFTANAALAETPAPHAALEPPANDILVGLPVLAFGLTYLLHPDPAIEVQVKARGFTGTVGGFNFLQMTGSPRHDLGLALLRTEVVTFGLKSVVNEERPNGENKSFPSAHTSTTFAAAEFIRKEYGWGWGTPAYLAAGFTGWSRVENREHYWQDVVAGAVIGVLANHDIGQIGPFAIRPAMLDVSPRNSRYQAQPEQVGAAPGVTVEMHF